MLSEYRASLNKRGYEVYDVVSCRSCTIFYLQDIKDSSKMYVLKLFTCRNVPDDETFTSWYNAFRLRCKKLGDYEYKNVRIPHALEFWEDENLPGYGKTFGILGDYVNGRTLSETLYSNLDNDDDRRTLLLKVIPDYIDGLEYGNKLGYYHLDIDEYNLLVDADERGWLIDHIGAFICDDYKQGSVPDGGYMHCYSDRIAPFPSRASEFAEMAKSDGLKCERLQTVMLIMLMKGLFDKSFINELGNQCLQNQYSSLEVLRSNLKKAGQ